MSSKMAAIRTLWLAIGLLASFTASAQRVEGDRAKAEGVYAAEVQVNGQGEGQRNAAFARGLVQVLSKLSGDRAAAGRPGIGEQMRRAKEYVVGYDYRQDEGVSSSGAPSFNTTLVIRYAADKVNVLAATLSLPVWPQPRPKPVLWLAIDDGSGPRLVGLGKAEAARSTLRRAVERGYKLGLPSGSAAEQAVVGAIWRGDTAAVARASQRYSPPMQLIGKLYRNKSDGWKADWIFVDKGKVLSKWSNSDSDARKAMASGADGAADALMRRYARRGKPVPATADAAALELASADPGERHSILFTGIDSSDDYIRLSGYLQRLPAVRKITPVRATAEGVVLELALVGGLPGFKRTTSDGGVIDAATIDGVEGDTPPTYRLR